MCCKESRRELGFFSLEKRRLRDYLFLKVSDKALSKLAQIEHYPCFDQKVGPDGLLRSFPTEMILQLYPLIVTSCSMQLIIDHSTYSIKNNLDPRYCINRR